MSQRLLRVRELLKREISAVLQRDYTFDDALVTVSGVDVTPDLRQGHVFVGIIGDEGAKAKVLAKLNSEHGAIQQRMSRRVVLKYTPQLHFELDDSVERGVRTLALIQEIDELDADGDEESGEEGDD